ncbi:MAG: HAMP domain-containing protein [Gammaproteobacteria bacterium]|nr:HAMP domain-containing protein [Gammaproteobacteria bacterium]
MLQFFQSVKGRLSFLLSLAIISLLFFGSLSYEKFNNVRHTMTDFQTELKNKRTKIADQQQEISATKADFSLQKAQISEEKANISEKKIDISRQKEDMIAKSFQTAQKTGIVYLSLETLAKGQQVLWEHAYLRKLTGKDTGLIKEMKALALERKNLLLAFHHLKTQDKEEKEAKEAFFAYIKEKIRPLLKESVMSIHKGKLNEFDKLKNKIPEEYQELKALGHTLIKIINAQTKQFDSLRESLRWAEEDFISKEKKMIEKEKAFTAKEEKLKEKEVHLNEQSKQLEIEGDEHLSQLSEDIDAAIRTIFLVMGIAVLVLMVGGFLLVRSITKPIDTLRESADQLASGNLELKIDTSRKDELGFLAISFDQMRNAISKKLSDLAILNSTGEKMAGMFQEDIVLKEAIRIMHNQTNVETGSIYLLDENNELRLSAYYPDNAAAPHKDYVKTFQMGEGIAGYVASKMKTIFIPDITRAPNFIKNKGSKPRALLCVPMMDDKKIFGVMNFSGEVDKVTFDEEDEGFALTIARMAVITAKNINMVSVIEEQNRTLEQKVLERTAELRVKTNDINSMLQNMQQGIFTIIKGNLIHQEYSAYLEAIFDDDELAGKNALNFLFDNSNLGSNDLNQIDACMGSLIGEDAMMFDFNSHLLVTEYGKTLPSGKERILELDWNAVVDEDDVIDKVMVTVRDVTDLRALQIEADKQKEELELIGQILSLSQQKFQGFIKSSYEFIDENEKLIKQNNSKDMDIIATLFRNMHTIKGNARTYGLSFITDIVHDTETTYDKLRQEDDFEWQQDDLLNELNQVKESVKRYELTYDQKLSGFSGKNGLFVDQKLFDTITHSIGEAKQSNHLEDIQTNVHKVHSTLEAIGTEEISDVLEDILGGLPNMAKDLNKELPDVIINDNNIRLKEEVTSILKDVFMHTFRNSMDHGLETAEIRKAVGKAITGRIEIVMEVKGDMLSISYNDDGKGLGLDHLYKKALENDYFTPDQRVSDQEIAELIFNSGCSTAESVTMVSGRGVGMDAIKRFIQRLGGDITLEFKSERDEQGFRRFSQVITLPKENCVEL